MMSDCEELVGVTHRRWWGWSCRREKTMKDYFFRIHLIF